MDTNDKGAITEVSMDATLDDIDDLPGFVVFPSGAYRVELVEGMEEKKINEHPAIEAAMTLQEVMEMTEPLADGEEPPKTGDVCTLSFMRDNKYGVAAFKEFAKPLAERLGTRVIGELCSQSKGLQLLVVIKRTYDEKKDRYYPKVKKVSVL